MAPARDVRGYTDQLRLSFPRLPGIIQDRHLSAFFITKRPTRSFNEQGKPTRQRGFCKRLFFTSYSPVAVCGELVNNFSPGFVELPVRLAAGLRWIGILTYSEIAPSSSAAPVMGIGLPVFASRGRIFIDAIWCSEIADL
jgi:hypothetical protein